MKKLLTAIYWELFAIQFWMMHIEDRSIIFMSTAIIAGITGLCYAISGMKDKST